MIGAVAGEGELIGAVAGTEVEVPIVAGVDGTPPDAPPQTRPLDVVAIFSAHTFSEHVFISHLNESYIRCRFFFVVSNES